MRSQLSSDYIQRERANRADGALRTTGAHSASARFPFYWYRLWPIDCLGSCRGLSRSGVLGSSFLAIRLLGGWLRLRALVESGLLPDTHQYDAIIQRLRERLRVTRPIRVLESARVAAPAIIGWLRPVLLVPLSLSGGLTLAQLETIFAHELAHIRRHDYAVNLL
ncbi:MAG: M56 family metallopeptidase [Gemmatimonadaceae bacterium]